MADIQQKHQLAVKQLTDQHTSSQSESSITQLKSQLATQQVSVFAIPHKKIRIHSKYCINVEL